MVRNREWTAEDSRAQQYVCSFGLEQVRQAVELHFRTPLAAKSWRKERARYASALIAREEAVATLAATAAVLELSTAAVHHLLGRAQ